MLVSETFFLSHLLAGLLNTARFVMMSFFHRGELNLLESSSNLEKVNRGCRDASCHFMTVSIVLLVEMVLMNVGILLHCALDVNEDYPVLVHSVKLYVSIMAFIFVALWENTSRVVRWYSDHCRCTFPPCVTYIYLVLPGFLVAIYSIALYILKANK